MEFKGGLLYTIQRGKICACAFNIYICVVLDNFAHFTHMLQHVKRAHDTKQIDNEKKFGFKQQENLVRSQLAAVIWASVQSLGCHQGKVTVTAGDCGYCSYKIHNLPLAFTASTQAYPLNLFFFFIYSSFLKNILKKRFQSRSKSKCIFFVRHSLWERKEGATFEDAFLLSKKVYIVWSWTCFFSSESLARSQAGSTQCALWYEGCFFLSAPLWPPVTFVVLSIPSNMFACVSAGL